MSKYHDCSLEFDEYHDKLVIMLEMGQRLVGKILFFYQFLTRVLIYFTVNFFFALNWWTMGIMCLFVCIFHLFVLFLMDAKI